MSELPKRSSQMLRRYEDPTQLALTHRQRALKRMFDIVGASIGLTLTGPLIATSLFAATVDTRKCGLFTQVRIGRKGKPFRVMKIRTMRDLPDATTTVTTADDRRITPLGRLLRKTKIDELPQLINVLLGNMSFVGPRPDVPGFADRLEGRDRVILEVRPGITGPATLRFRNEELELAMQSDPEDYNRNVIFPEKVRLNREYVESYSISRDLALIWKTMTSTAGGTV